MLLKDLITELQTSKHGITIKFLEKIDDMEKYPEKDMIGTITDIEIRDDELVKILISYKNFEEHNKKLETSNYYDENGEPTLNAREAEEYSIEETFFFEKSLLGKYFTRNYEDNEKGLLFEEYLKSSNQEKDSYITWLEESLMIERSLRTEQKSKPLSL